MGESGDEKKKRKGSSGTTGKLVTENTLEMSRFEGYRHLYNISNVPTKLETDVLDFLS